MTGANRHLLPPPLSTFPARLRASTRRWRVPLAMLGLSVLVTGIGLSLSALELEWDQINLPALAVNALVLVPAGLALAALNLQLLAHAIGRRIRFRTGVAVGAIGRIAELMPLPGGAMVRGAALMRAGASLGESSMLIMVTGLLTLSMSAALSGTAMMLAGHARSGIVLVIGMLGVAACSTLVLRRAGAGLTFRLILLRFAVLGIGAARLVATFEAIGVPLTGFEAAIFIICTSLSTAATIVPGGLGVAETSAAGLALYVNIAPAAAFLAVALNSIIGLVICGAVALVAVWRAGAKPARDAADLDHGKGIDQ